MRSSRFYAMLVLMSSCYAVGAGCGDDDDPASPGGTGGKSDAGAGRGGGGSSGRGGSAGSAGTGGMGGGMMGSGGASGRGGTAGSAGTTGTAGTAGSAGTAGTAGTTGTGGSAGMDASSDAPDSSVNDASPDVSNDGSAGDTGSDVIDAGTAFKRCVEKCDSVDDCAQADGAPSGMVCNSQGQCAASNAFPSTCSNNTQCMIRARLTSLDCDASTPCSNPNQVCADGGGGRGKCIARAPSDGGNCTGATNPDRTTVNVIGGDSGSTAEICLNDINRCGPENECYQAVCQSDENCSPQLGGPICNTQTGRCDCVVDNDCGSIQNTNKCINGRCGCTSAAACTVRVFPAATASCE
jgi:hypothetical protein